MKVDGTDTCVKIGGAVSIGVGGSSARADRLEGAGPLRLDIIVPVVMCCAMLWWVSRGISWTTRWSTAVTLVLIICVLLFER